MIEIGDSVSRLADAIEVTLGELDAPPEDAILVCIARQAAADIDAMPPAVRQAMMPQTAGILMRALRELDQRAQKRGKAAGGAKAAPVSRLDAMRAARAAGSAGTAGKRAR